MATADRVADLRLEVAERPKTALFGLFVLGLCVDLLLKIFGVEVAIGSVKLFGGTLAASRLITLVWNGVVVGLGIGLAGIGLSMTYSILSFANFAHGDYITTGAFAGWAVAWLLAGLGSGLLDGNVLFLGTLGFGPDGPSAADLSVNALSNPLAVFAGLVVAVVATIAVSLALDRVVFRPMRDQSGIAVLIASIGVALALRYLIVFFFGPTNRGLTAGGSKLILAGVSGKLALATERSTIVLAANDNVPSDAFYVELPGLDFGSYTAEILSVTSAEATLVVTSLALMVALHLALQRTKLGKAMRAMADNEDLARVTGIPTERVVRATWVIGGGLAGAAGFLMALERGTLSYNLGWVLLLLIFAAVILGGIGSIYGAMVGGLLIGLTQSVSLVWIPSSFSTAAAFAIMILVLVIRPDGLFGGVTTA
ncbi:putative branched-chain amino acids ABC transporter permease [Halosimplex carlsbadense 2-9-1]|uniref:Putative branched-chain amino acids ABC transporter permease n=1 Tax=Halosimplex carlsbadense 2-9-1 TaxID=797114 RepID=M0CLY0_9EURY|nr:branched-chain amino acid ABC transporter permease [Halosimplex carlsbadense]ELZ24280.1 putative branched-chain amino acids ABC transporter permease [Halosimplex carlsbadense 2-9-1]